MSKCINCGKSNASVFHKNGGCVCDDCLGEFFNCPDCGRVFDMDDYQDGDAGNGFCAKCAPEH